MPEANILAKRLVFPGGLATNALAHPPEISGLSKNAPNRSAPRFPSEVAEVV